MRGSYNLSQYTRLLTLFLYLILGQVDQGVGEGGHVTSPASAFCLDLPHIPRHESTMMTPSLDSAAVAVPDSGGEAPCIRTYFYIGGSYVKDSKGEHIFGEQMYVEKLIPISGATQDTPIIFIHGLAQTGSNFLNKPDGGLGWASEFILQGYEVYIIDQTLRGRSAWQPGTSSPSTYSAEFIQQRFTAAKSYNLWPQAHKHTQWPGLGTMGDPVFDAFYSSNVQSINDPVYIQKTMQIAGAALLDKIGKPVILIGHSQGGSFPTLIADARPHLTKIMVLLEPSGPPFRDAVFSSKPARPWGLTDIPLTYDPPVGDPAELVKQTYPSRGDGFVEFVLQAESPAPRRLVNLVDKPILIMTGEASYHSPYDYATAKYFQQAGCHKTEHIELGEFGIHGNGHMFFMEKNSHEIYEVVRDWIQKQ